MKHKKLVEITCNYAMSFVFLLKCLSEIFSIRDEIRN